MQNIILNIISILIWLIVGLFSIYLFYKNIKLNNDLKEFNNIFVKNTKNVVNLKKLENYTVKEIKNIYKNIDYKKENELRVNERLKFLENQTEKLNKSKKVLFNFLKQYTNQKEINDIEQIINDLEEDKK